MEENKTIDMTTEEVRASETTVEETVETIAEEAVNSNLPAPVNADDILAEIEAYDEVDEKVEILCRWAAARAGVIVVAPLLGTGALILNEVYLVTRIAKQYDKKLSQGAMAGFLGAIGGTVAGNLLTTLIPLSVVQIPVAVGVTYAVGKVAHAWIKDGMPSDTDRYKPMVQEWTEKAKTLAADIAKDPMKAIPLGDETVEDWKKKFDELKETVGDKAEKVGEVAREKAGIAAEKAKEAAAVAKEKAGEAAGKAKETAAAAKEKAEDVAGKVKEKVKGSQSGMTVDEAAEEVETVIREEVTADAGEPADAEVPKDAE